MTSSPSPPTNSRRTRCALILAVLAGMPACGRHKLAPDELERNHRFAQILEREDRRMLGDDGLLADLLEHSRHPEVRAWSARALGRIGDPRALPWLHAALASPYAAVRAAAAFAAGEIEDRDARAREARAADPGAALELRRRLDDPSPEVRLRATEALGKVGGPEEGRAIALRLERLLAAWSADPVERARAAHAITALMRLADPAAVPLLERCAAGADPELQWRACQALARLRAARARPTFERLVQSPDARVRAHALRGLGICADPALAELAAPLVAAREPLAVRAAAAAALGTLGSRASIGALRAALETLPVTADHPEQVNFAVVACEALGRLAEGAPDEAAVALVPLLRADAPAAQAALSALGRALRGRESFFAAVEPADSASAAGLRAWARALGEHGSRAAVKRLESLLLAAAEAPAGSALPQAVPALVAALGRTRDPAAVRLAESFLESNDGVVVRAALAAAPPEAGRSDRWAILARAYDRLAARPDAETKVALIDALQPYAGLPDVRAVLERARRDRQRNVRIAAEALLRKTGASGGPFEPGPAESTGTQLSYALVAADRRERTLAVLETTRGVIEIALFREEAPLTVSNFVRLVRAGFYDGLLFMRVVPDFVIQGGDPRNDTEGGPGYTLRCEINLRPFDRGAVGMALAGKDTGGSQFFITLSPQPHLDGGYTCFGRVVSGMEAADRMTSTDRILRTSIRETRSALDFRRY